MFCRRRLNVGKTDTADNRQFDGRRIKVDAERKAQQAEFDSFFQPDNQRNRAEDGNLITGAARRRRMKYRVAEKIFADGRRRQLNRQFGNFPQNISDESVAVRSRPQRSANGYSLTAFSIAGMAFCASSPFNVCKSCGRLPYQ